jgi:hypothetical protein
MLRKTNKNRLKIMGKNKHSKNKWVLPKKQLNMNSITKLIIKTAPFHFGIVIGKTIKEEDIN